MENMECNQEHYDYMLAACGMDSRAYEVVRRLKDKKVQIDNLIMFDYKERNEGLSTENGQLYYCYKDIYKSIVKITCSMRDPSSCIKKIQDERYLKRSKRIGIDISCFTKPFFFLIMKMMKLTYKLEKISVFYTEPKSYIFPEGLYDSYRSSEGPLQIIEIPGFTGMARRQGKRILVILIGFDGDLSSEISEDVAPQETTIINGFPGYEPKFKDISLISNEKLINNPRNSLTYSRANNPFETYNILDKIKNENKDDFINIAPLGTKPMALGACMYALHNPDVRIVYPMPLTYRMKTTDNCSKSWMYEIPLNMKNERM